MARQVGILHKIGREGGESFFYSRRGGFQSRQPAVGMGARVLKESEFENTRRNASEFRTSAIVAGNMVRGIEDQFPGFLKGNVKADLTKVIRKLSERDTIHNWGEREVPFDDMKKVQDELNRHSVSPVPDWVTNLIYNHFVYDPSNSYMDVGPDFYIPKDYLDLMSSIGAQGMALFSNILNIRSQSAYSPYYPTPDSGISYYLRSPGWDSYTLQEWESEPLSSGGIGKTDFVPSNMSGNYGGYICMMIPWKIIGNRAYEINKYRWGGYFPVPIGTVTPTRNAKSSIGGIFGKLLNMK